LREARIDLFFTLELEKLLTDLAIKIFVKLSIMHSFLHEMFTKDW